MGINDPNHRPALAGRKRVWSSLEGLEKLRGDPGRAAGAFGAPICCMTRELCPVSLVLQCTAILLETCVNFGGSSAGRIGGVVMGCSDALLLTNIVRSARSLAGRKTQKLLIKSLSFAFPKKGNSYPAIGKNKTSGMIPKKADITYDGGAEGEGEGEDAQRWWRLAFPRKRLDYGKGRQPDVHIDNRDKTGFQEQVRKSS